MTKQRFRLLLSYNGSGYYGWQRQKNLPTIQEALEKALKVLTKKTVHVIGSGRTDTGTHALGQAAHFDIATPLPSDLNLKNALNGVLISKNIWVRQIWKAPKEFHALQSATKKYYKYFIYSHKWPCIFRQNQIYWHAKPLNKTLLQSMSAKIIGRHDFSSFQNSGSKTKHNLRTIYLARWESINSRLWVFHIQGDGFLKQMVRNLVGTQLALLRQKNPLQRWLKILKAQDRKQAFVTSPACGLYLYKVFYPTELDRACQKI